MVVGRRKTDTLQILEAGNISLRSEIRQPEGQLREEPAEAPINKEGTRPHAYEE